MTTTEPEVSPEEILEESPHVDPINDRSIELTTQMMSMLVRFILHRLNTGRDVKIIIVARGAATGTGKSTLAVQLAQWVHSLLQCTNCRYRNEHGEYVGGMFPREYDACPWCGGRQALTRPEWTTDRGAYIDIMDYCTHYAHRADPAEAIVLDEAEEGLDKRRAMSHENVQTSKYWAALRFKNCVNFMTLPDSDVIDKRMEKYADVQITVYKRGYAHLRWLWLNDSTGHVEKPWVKSEHGLVETLNFEDLSTDAEYQELSDLKRKHFSFDGSGKTIYDQDDLEDAIKEHTREIRIETAKELWDKTDLNQTEIADIVERSQQWVSKAVNGKFDE